MGPWHLVATSQMMACLAYHLLLSRVTTRKKIWRRQTVSHWLRVCFINACCTGGDLLYDGTPTSQSPVVQEPNQEMIQPSLLDVFDALQGQQALLQKVLKEQEAIGKKQKEQEISLNTLTEEVQLVKEAGTPTEKQQRKTKVPRDLTVSHCLLPTISHNVRSDVHLFDDNIAEWEGQLREILTCAAWFGTLQCFFGACVTHYFLTIYL